MKVEPKPFFTPVRRGLLQRCTSTIESDDCRNKRRTLQRTSVSHAEPSSVPPIVHEVVRSPGHPLDAATRAFMEPRFGHDFSKVRVHTDTKAGQSARAVNALAYTMGTQVVFGEDQYKPRTGIGRILIAHELVHTIQQQNSTCDSATEDSALERNADNAVSAVLLGQPVAISSLAAPPIQFLRVTTGALGKALEVFTNQWKVPDRAIKLLGTSPTFMKVAATIDNNYVWRGDSFKTDPAGETGPDGRLIKGPFKGRRELFDVLFGEPEFEPSEAPPEPGKIKVSGDVINIKSTDVPGFISEMAHEATHAARFVGAAAPPPATIVDEVNASITEEVETRKSEAKILAEISAPDVRARVAQVGTRVPALVERDISPAFGLTYVENAFFASRLREAKAKDGITDEDADKIREEIEKDFKAKTLLGPKLHFKPQLGRTGLYELSDYGDVWFNRRLAQAEWAEFQKDHRPTDPDFAVEKEKLVQDHAKRFFEGPVSYQPLAQPKTTP